MSVSVESTNSTIPVEKSATDLIMDDEEAVMHSLLFLSGTHPTLGRQTAINNQSLDDDDSDSEPRSATLTSNRFKWTSDNEDAFQKAFFLLQQESKHLLFFLMVFFFFFCLLLEKMIFISLIFNALSF